jgi:hypothetical protein
MRPGHVPIEARVQRERPGGKGEEMAAEEAGEGLSLVLVGAGACIVNRRWLCGGSVLLLPLLPPLLVLMLVRPPYEPSLFVSQTPAPRPLVRGRRESFLRAPTTKANCFAGCLPASGPSRRRLCLIDPSRNVVECRVVRGGVDRKKEAACGGVGREKKGKRSPVRALADAPKR